MALNFFIQKGYSGIFISMIAETLGMSKANLYHYCSSREDLSYKVQLDYPEKYFIPIIEGAEKVSDPTDLIAFWFDTCREVNAEELAETLVQTSLDGLPVLQLRIADERSMLTHVEFG